MMIMFQTSLVLSLVASSCFAFSTLSTNRFRRSRHGEVTSPLYSSAIAGGSSSSLALSDASAWHRDRRKQMMEKYGDQIEPLERANSQAIGLPLLMGANLTLLLLSLVSGSLPTWGVFLLAIFPGSICSLWQLQLLHDVVHGCFLDKKSVNKKRASERLLFWGSMPSIFGYYLYLKYGHLSHHKNLGNPQKATLERLFDSNQADFEDGDVLFVAHRMKLKGDIGPKIPLLGKVFKISISNFGFRQWREGNAIWNAATFAASFLFERVAIASNDIVVALLGKNLYFPNKPQSFHDDCANYARCALGVRFLLWAVAGWKALLFLYLSETLWSIPPHPACAMFLTNHGSDTDPTNGSCVPSSSTYAGKWYEFLTLNTVFHVEHHDFPTIPFDKLGELRTIAPEFYPGSVENKDNVFSIMNNVFESPDFYACMDAGLMQKEQ